MAPIHCFAHIFFQTYLKIVKLLLLETRFNNILRKKESLKK